MMAGFKSGNWKSVLCSAVFVLLTGSAALAQNDETNKPQTVYPGDNGAIVLHASTGLASGTEIKYMPEWKAFGWFRSDGKVEWDIKVNRRGQYRVVLEWSVSDEEAGKKFVLQAGDQKLEGVVAGSGSWETFKSREIGHIRLRAGQQKIVFKPSMDFGKGALLDLRAITLLPENK